MLLNEYREFAAKIDELNEVGSAYDASLKGVEITTPIARSKLYICDICNNNVGLIQSLEKPNLCVVLAFAFLPLIRNCTSAQSMAAAVSKSDS